MARELSNSVCLSWIMSVIDFLHSFSSCSASVPEDLSELLALLWELTEYKSNTLCFDRAHPQPTAYVATPKLWNHYQNIDYISVSPSQRRKAGQKAKKSCGLVHPWAVSSDLVAAQSYVLLLAGEKRCDDTGGRSHLAGGRDGRWKWKPRQFFLWEEPWKSSTNFVRFSHYVQLL